MRYKDVNSGLKAIGILRKGIRSTTRICHFGSSAFEWPPRRFLFLLIAHVYLSVVRSFHFSKMVSKSAIIGQLTHLFEPISFSKWFAIIHPFNAPALLCRSPQTSRKSSAYFITSVSPIYSHTKIFSINSLFIVSLNLPSALILDLNHILRLCGHNWPVYPASKRTKTNGSGLDTAALTCGSLVYVTCQRPSTRMKMSITWFFSLAGSCQNQDSEESREGDYWEVLHSSHPRLWCKQTHLRRDRNHSQQAP